jgi:hypothetical protein
LATTTQGREADQTWSFRGSKSRNKVSVGEPAEGSLPRFSSWRELGDTRPIVICTFGDERERVCVLWLAMDRPERVDPERPALDAAALANLNFGGRGRLDLPAAGRNLFYSATRT